jgi:hypothetical protein
LERTLRTESGAFLLIVSDFPKERAPAEALPRSARFAAGEEFEVSIFEGMEFGE